MTKLSTETMDVLFFTQGFADNEKVVRMRTLNLLKKFFKQQSKDKGLTYDEMIKIWKGLFYCMYNADKPLVQENLAEDISCLIHRLQPRNQKRLFFKVALDTFGREWNGIDNFRMDKYFMLFTRVFRQCLIFLSQIKWLKSEVKAVSSSVESSVVAPFDKTNFVPLGLKIHMIDIYLEELAKVGKESLPTSVLVIFILPFIKALSVSKEIILIKAIQDNILDMLIRQTDSGIEMKEDVGMNEREVTAKKRKLDEIEEDEKVVMDPRAGGVDVCLPQLKPDFEAISNVIQSVGSLKEISSKKRSLLYSYAKRFSNVAHGIYPFPKPSFKVKVPNVKDIAKKEIIKKAKMDSINEDDKSDDEEEDLGATLRKKKKKRRAKNKGKNNKNIINISEPKSKKNVKKSIKEKHELERTLIKNLSLLSKEISASNITGYHQDKVNDHATSSNTNKSPKVPDSKLVKNKKKSVDNSCDAKDRNSLKPKNDFKSSGTNNKGLITNANSKGLITNANSKGLITNANSKGLITNDDGWQVMKIVPKSTDSNKVIKGKDRKLKRLQKNSSFNLDNNNKGKDNNKEIRDVKADTGAVEIKKVNKNEEGMNMEKIPHKTPENVSSYAGKKMRRRKEKNNKRKLDKFNVTVEKTSDNNEVTHENLTKPETKKELEENTDIIRPSKKLKKLTSPVQEKQERSPSTTTNKKNKLARKHKIKRKQTNQQKSGEVAVSASGKMPTEKSDPWSEPLKEGEVEIVIPAKKVAKKRKSKEALNMVINKTPKMNTRGRTLKINLSCNKEHDLHHYKKVLQSCPGIPYSAHKKPVCSVLKPSPSPIAIKKSMKTKLRSMKLKYNL